MLATTPAELSDHDPSHLPLLIRLPDELHNFFGETGYSFSFPDEHRSAARLKVRSEAILRGTKLPVFLRRPQRLARVFVKDLSRTGVGILAHEQIWPAEEFMLDFCGRKLVVRAVRCRKLCDRCFDVGGIVLSVERTNA